MGVEILKGNIPAQKAIISFGSLETVFEFRDEAGRRWRVKLGKIDHLKKVDILRKRNYTRLVAGMFLGITIFMYPHLLPLSLAFFIASLFVPSEQSYVIFECKIGPFSFTGKMDMDDFSRLTELCINTGGKYSKLEE